MRNRHFYTRLSVEGIEAAATAPGEEVVAEPIAEGTDGLEAELIEVNNDIVEVGDTEESTDEATEVVDELEVAAESLRDIAANGGLDRNGARVLALYQASINKRLGLPKTANSFSAEAFGGTNTRAGQTSLAAESIADQAKDLWKKIVEMFKAALKAIVAVWNRIFDGATRLKARADKLIASAAATKGEKSAETFEAQKLAAGLHMSGKVDAVHAATRVQEEASSLPEMAGASMHFADAVLKLMADASAADAIDSVISRIGTDMSKNFKPVSDPASVGMTAPGEGLELRKFVELPGNKTIVATVAVAGAKPEAVAKVGYKLATFDASKKVADNTKLPTLSTQDVGSIGTKIAAAAEAVLGYKGLQKEAEASANKVIAAAEAKAKSDADANKGDKGMIDAAKAKYLSGSEARSMTKGAMSAVINGIPPLAAFVLNAGGMCVQYGEQSLKQYGKPKEAAKPAAEPAKAAA